MCWKMKKFHEPSDLRNPPTKWQRCRSTRTERFLCLKIVRFVSKIENLTSQNWVSCCDLSLMSRQDLLRILTGLYLVNIQVLAKVFRPTPIKRYKASKNGFLVLFFTIFELQDSNLPQKVWNCEKLVWLWNKWLWNPYVAGFDGPHEHNNSI